MKNNKEIGESVIKCWYNKSLRREETARGRSFIQAIGERGIEFRPDMIRYKPEIHAADYLNYGYEETVQALKGADRKTTAIIADDDRTAYSAMNAIRDLGLRVPEDVSLFVICGDLSKMNQASPALTSMDLQPSELGVQSVRLLLHKLGVIEGEHSNHWIVNSEIIERSSCSSV